MMIKKKQYRKNSYITNVSKPIAIAVKKELKKNVEVKTVESSNAATSAGVYTSFLSAPIPVNVVLNNVNQGVARTQRIGDSILMKSLDLRIELIAVQDVINPTSQQVRILVVYDKQANNAPPGFNLFLSNDNAVTLSPANPAYFDRYLVIIDERVSVVQDSNTRSVSLDFFRKLRLKVKYNATSGTTYENFTSGSLTMWIVTNNSNSHQCNFFSRVRYYDI